MTNTEEGQHCECVHDGYVLNMGTEVTGDDSMQLEEGEGKIAKKKYPQ